MENVLEVRKLRKNTTLSSCRISASTCLGEASWVCWANGAGKTTAIKLILNLIRADAGEIKIFGEKHNALDRKLKSKLEVFDECNFPDT